MKKRYTFPLIAAVLILLYIAANAAGIYTFSAKDQTCRVDAAIILGAATYNGTVSPVYRERINHGIALYKEGYAGKLIVTGGVGAGNTVSDAAAAKQYALSQGVPPADIYTEDASAITQENLVYAKNIMEAHQLHTALIVSDPLHMKRAMLLARDAGITAYSSPTPTSKYTSLKTQLPFLAREVFYYIGYKWYRIFAHPFQ
ncbi:MAG TPA: YdcF family protein [Candidatus Avimonoglobus intestinipullorum]|uniref:YdcF family protein n=1 Tax=Candidatus Avimonoglobus intestinipullorum TaxID=2840699 RepID=A0A9D1LVI3_9FIRM|nr:YdcF family protein [Candidatus Avimonoglobus intestinipullorum]